MPEPLIRNISDTARWVAVYRAWETERADAVFRDPFARRLAGERGEQIAATMPFKNAWPFIARTWAFDHFISQEVERGVDVVVNLAAGLDARPYRMKLPASLQWIEVDLPDLLTYKEETLGSEKPVCKLERIRLDLADVPARRELFQQIAGRGKRVLVVTEGLIGYLTDDEVGMFAQDLAVPPSFQRWILDIGSPGLLRVLRKRMPSLADSGVPLKFAPEAGPDFFRPYGWRCIEVRSMIKTAAKIKRLSFLLRLIALLPESKGRQGNKPWSGVCLMERT